MSHQSAGIPIETLLSQTDWVRRLAYSLTRDTADADDLVQETWLAAARHPPSHDTNLRSWLRTVMKNIHRKRHRGESRRVAREQATARSEAEADVAELTARAGMLSEVAAHVQALDEVHRAVVLLRYFDDLPPRTIAERLGVSVNTVNSRLQRAHARLREVLRDKHGEGWVTALAPLLRWPPAGAPRQGPEPARSSDRRARRVAAVAAAALLVVAGLSVVAALGRDRAPRTRDAQARPDAAAASAGPGRRHTAGGGATPAAAADAGAVAAPATTATPATTQPSPDSVALEGSVTSASATAGRITLRLTPLTVGFDDIAGEARTVETAPGSVALTLPRRDARGRRIAEWQVDAAAPGHDPTSVRVRMPLAVEGGEASMPNLVLQPGRMATGTVTWDGDADATATVASFPAEGQESHPFDSVQCGRGAEFRLRLPAGRAIVAAVLEGRVPACRVIAAPAPGEAASAGAFLLLPGHWIRGRVDAGPLRLKEGARVRIWTTDPHERCIEVAGFFISLAKDGVTAERDDTSPPPSADGAFAAGGFGAAPFKLVLESEFRIASDVAQPVLSRTLRAPTDHADLVFEGTAFDVVVTSGGAPLAGASVLFAPPGGTASSGTTGADGSVTFVGKPGSTYPMRVKADGHLDADASVTVPASGPAARTVVDLVAKPPVQPATWVVRVRAPTGEPLPVVGFGLCAPGNDGEFVVVAPKIVRDVTPIDGTCRIEGVPPGRWHLEIRPGCAWYDPAGFLTAAPIERDLGSGQVVEDEVTAAPAGRVVVAAPDLQGLPQVWIGLRVFDDAHRAVPVLLSNRRGRWLVPAAGLPYVGPSDVFPALPPGRYTVETDPCPSNRLGPAAETFEVAAGRVTYVTVRPPRR